MEESKKFKISFNPKVLRFVFVFLALLAVFYFLSIKFETSIPAFSMEHTSKVLHFLLQSVGVGNELNGNQLVFSNFAIEIVRQCTGIFEVMAITACILSYPSSVKKKTIGISLAIPIIYIFNMLRLILLSVIGIYNPAVFKALHDYILQLTFVFLVIFFWIFWINRVVKHDNAKHEVVSHEKG